METPMPIWRLVVAAGDGITSGLEGGGGGGGLLLCYLEDKPEKQ